MAVVSIELGGLKRLAVANIASPADDDDFVILENDNNLVFSGKREYEWEQVKGLSHKVPVKDVMEFTIKGSISKVATDPAYGKLKAAFASGDPIKCQIRNNNTSASATPVEVTASFVVTEFEETSAVKGSTKAAVTMQASDEPNMTPRALNGGA